MDENATGRRMLSMWKQRRRNEITHLNSDHQFSLLFFFSGLSKRSGSSGLSLPLYHLVTAKITIPKAMIRKFSIQNSNLTVKLMSSMLLITVTLISGCLGIRFCHEPNPDHSCPSEEGEHHGPCPFCDTKS